MPRTDTYVPVRFDAPTLERIQRVADAEYDGKRSGAIRRLVREALDYRDIEDSYCPGR